MKITQSLYLRTEQIFCQGNHNVWPIIDLILTPQLVNYNKKNIFQVFPGLIRGKKPVVLTAIVWAKCRYHTVGKLNHKAEIKILKVPLNYEYDSSYHLKQ